MAKETVPAEKNELPSKVEPDGAKHAALACPAQESLPVVAEFAAQILGGNKS